MARVRNKTKGQRETCFVIMPFGGWLDGYYGTIYSPAVDAVGLEPHRADDLFRPSTIVNDIWSYTKRAKLLLADLTGKNPNVFYELGLAHALGKPVILVAESMDDIPFDLRALRIILYDKNAPDWGRLLRDKVEASIKEVLASPVDAVLPAFLEVRDTPPKPTVSQGEREIIEIKQELELLRRAIRSTESTKPLLPEQPRIRFNEAVARVERLVAEGMPDDAIIEDFVRRGAPSSWVPEQIRRLKEENRPQFLKSKRKRKRPGGRPNKALNAPVGRGRPPAR